MVIQPLKNCPILPSLELGFFLVNPNVTFAQGGQLHIELSQETMDNMTMSKVSKHISGSLEYPVMFPGLDFILPRERPQIALEWSKVAGCNWE